MFNWNIKESPILGLLGLGGGIGSKFSGKKLPPPPTVDYLVVAGGGGRGYGYYYSGGGGGGFRNGTLPISPGTSYSITIGAGGAGFAGGAAANGVKGNDTIFSTITSTGGGYGARNGQPGGPGGSGGGAGGDYPGPVITFPGGVGNDPPTSPPQGNPGASANQWPSSPGASTGGGGGRGAAASGINGGNGSVSSISGSPIYYSGGGAGTQAGTGASGTPGLGSGDTANRGGGGTSGPAGYNGGPGVVIVAYPDIYGEISSIDVGLTYIQPSRSGYIVYEFINGTGNISW